MTNLEKTIYDAAVKLCLAGEYSVDAKDLAAETKLDVKTVRGVMGSLVKKNLMESDGADVRGGQVYYDAFPMNADGEICSMGEWQ